MKPTDLIFVNVTGTNGTTRHQKTISRRFNGLGQSLDDNGVPDGSPETLRSLPGAGAGQKAPDFPASEFAKAQQDNDAPKMKAIQIAYAQQYTAWEQSQGGGNENLQVAKAVLEYSKEFQGFQETDGNHFVMKLENLDVTVTTLNDGRSLYQVSGTAIFGATA